LRYTNPATYLINSEAVEVDQLWDGEEMKSCGYIVRADCGLPSVKFTFVSGSILASDLEMTVFEFAMDSTYMNALKERDYNGGDIEAGFSWPS